jgi:hypothetical protein
MAHHSHQTHAETIDGLPTDTEALPQATSPEVVEFSNGDSLELAPVAKRMLACCAAVRWAPSPSSPSSACCGVPAT